MLPAAPFTLACSASSRAHSVCHRIGIEGSGHHVGEGGDDNQGKQPAEQQEQLPSGLSDVFLNQQSHGFSFIFHTGIQRAEVCDSSEENAADEESREAPEASRMPLPGWRRSQGLRPRWKKTDGQIPSSRRWAHNPVRPLWCTAGCFRLRIDAPFLRQPASVQCICCDQAYGCDQYDYKSVHDFPLSFSMKQ